MSKDFDSWNLVKKNIDDRVIDRSRFFNERDIWWCALGLNIGVEYDGKNDNYERPILIIKKFNADMVWALPLTSQAHSSKYYVRITRDSWVCITQIKTVSTKRLLRKVGSVGEADFEIVISMISALLNAYKTKPPQSGGISEAEATSDNSVVDTKLKSSMLPYHLMSKSPRNQFAGDTIIRFEDVSFEYGQNQPILEEASFTVRRGTKITLMGQNGAGKTTIFGLILGLQPDSGEIHITNGATIATARQVIPREDLTLTVREFFAKALESGGRPKVYDLDPRIDAILEVVNLHAPKSTPTHKVTNLKDRHIKTFSGGQQARLLLASALIQDPDILLLDEPTNNLDKAGIEHLTEFLINYQKTCLVISHDAEFLNAFTHGVLYLDVHTRKVEQYVGDYKDVVEQISARIEKENMDNARLAKEIQAKKDQANVFAMKGGQMRLVAKRMREKAEELSEEIVDVRKEDKTIKPFTIPNQTDIIGDIITISKYTVVNPKTHKPVTRTCSIKLRRKQHLLLAGPNGIGKSTLLEKIVNGAEGTVITPGVRVGYYRQDFSMMDFNDTVYESLEKIVRSVQGRLVETELRAVAASFLIGADAIHTRIGSLSEGQKGLVAFARLVLLRPGLLILDEPTNHINFRHIPVIAKALDAYEGAMILVSHVPEFVGKVRIDEVLDLGK